MAKNYLYGEKLYGEELYGRTAITISDIWSFSIPPGYLQTSEINWSIFLPNNTSGLVVTTSLDGETWNTATPGGTISGLVDVTLGAGTTLFVKVEFYTTNTISSSVVDNITIDLNYPGFAHYAMTSDGRRFLNGTQVDYDFDFIGFDSSTGVLTLNGERQYEELYLTPRNVTNEEVKYWYGLQAPFRDVKDVINTTERSIIHVDGELTDHAHDIYGYYQGNKILTARFGVEPVSGDRGLFIYDHDENNNPVEVAFYGVRGFGDIVKVTPHTHDDIEETIRLGFLSGWTQITDTISYHSPTSIRITGDVSEQYEIGDKIRLTNQGSVKYYYVTGVTYSPPNTIISILGDNFANSTITDPYVSKAANPKGFPHWFNYTPSSYIGWTSNPSPSSKNVYKFKLEGRSVKVSITQSTAMAGSGSSVSVAGPFTAASTFYGTAGIFGSNTGNINGRNIVRIYGSSNMIEFLVDSGDTSWSSATSRRVNGFIEYEIA